MLGSTIVRLAECFGEFLVGPDPGGQTVECRFLTDVGSIGLCQLAFVIGSYSVFHLMNYELSDPYPPRVMVLCLHYFLRVVTLRALHSECIPLHSFTLNLGEEFNWGAALLLFRGRALSATE